MAFLILFAFQSWAGPYLQSPGKTNSLDAIIKAQHQIYLQALLDGDVDAYAAMFTEDAVLLFPGEFIKGRDRLRERQRQIFDQIEVLDGSIHTLSVEASGELAYEVGRFQYSVAGRADRRKVNLSGRFLAIWRKQADGTWLLAVDSGFPDPS